jgi:arylsulfatase A-like enzyme
MAASISRVRFTEARAEVSLAERPAAILLIAFWIALCGGLVEVLMAAGGRFVLHHYTHLNPHIAWMTPVGNAIIIAIPGLLFFVVLWLWPSKIAFRMALFVIAFLAFLGVLFRINRWHITITIPLAVILALIAALLISAHARRFYRLVRVTLGLLVATVLGLAIGVYGWQALAERRALAKLPPAAPGAPNVLLIVMDAVGAKHLSGYGYSRPTSPQLDKFVKTGVIFERAISTAPWTLPAHASMFTGRYPDELSIGYQKTLDSTYPTLAEALSERGYLTAGFTGNFIYTTRESGLDRGFQHYEDFPITPQLVVLNSGIVKQEIVHEPALIKRGFNDVYYGRKTAEKINDGFFRWLSQKDSQQPFFVFLNYYDCHSPYYQPKSFNRRFGKDKPLPTLNDHLDPITGWPESEVQAELDAYDNSVAYVDDQLGLLLEELKKRGLLEKTLVIVTGDHGEEFYEHGVMSHGWSTYMPAIHVPLVISYPSHIPAAKTVSEPVTLRDLPATVLDQLGFRDKSAFPGTSLARYWDTSRDFSNSAKSPPLSVVEPETDTLPQEFPIMRGQGRLQSLVMDRYHYIRSRNGSEELYDFVNDPLETHDLSTSDSQRQIIDQFRESLKAAFGH